MCPDGDYCEVAQDVMLFNEKHSDVSYAINKMNSCSKKSSPRKLDKLYKVGEILGKGGFGKVYQARFDYYQIKLNQYVHCILFHTFSIIQCLVYLFSLKDVEIKW